MPREAPVISATAISATAISATAISATAISATAISVTVSALAGAGGHSRRGAWLGWEYNFTPTSVWRGSAVVGSRDLR
jgi:hypothetical protein